MTQLTVTETAEIVKNSIKPSLKDKFKSQQAQLILRDALDRTFSTTPQIQEADQTTDPSQQSQDAETAAGKSGGEMARMTNGYDHELCSTLLKQLVGDVKDRLKQQLQNSSQLGSGQSQGNMLSPLSAFSETNGASSSSAGNTATSTTTGTTSNGSRYRLIVTATAGENRGAGVRMVCRCFWDSDTDCMVQESLVTPTLFVTVAAFAVYSY